MIRAHWTMDLLEAEVICGFLREHDVAAEVFDRDLVRQDWFRALALGGYRVMVPRGQAALAAELLRRRRAGEFTLEDSVPIDASCPACGSPRIEQLSLSLRLAIVSFMLFGLPLPWSRRNYRCIDCAHHWRKTPERFAQLAQQADEGAASQ